MQRPRVRLRESAFFEPLINALDAEQLPAAYAMLESLVKAPKSKRAPAKMLPPQKKAKKRVGSGVSLFKREGIAHQGFQLKRAPHKNPDEIFCELREFAKSLRLCDVRSLAF